MVKFCVAALMGSVLVAMVTGECTDSQDACVDWAAAGYCDEGSVYRAWMIQNCRKSCKQCDTPSDVCKGPVNKDWTLTKVEYDSSKQTLNIERHDLSHVTVSNGGSGSFSASGSNVQSAKFTHKSGVEVRNGVPMKMVVPVVSDEGKPSISPETETLIAGDPNWSYSNYGGTWYCKAEWGETKTCTAYINQFKVSTPYTQTWQAPGQECFAESTGVLDQELWGQPIIVNS